MRAPRSKRLKRDGEAPRTPACRHRAKNTRAGTSRRAAAGEHIAELDAPLRANSARSWSRPRPLPQADRRKARRAAGCHRAAPKPRATRPATPAPRPKPLSPKPTSTPRPPIRRCRRRARNAPANRRCSKARRPRIERTARPHPRRAGIAPDELAERAEIKDGEELPPLEQAEKRVEKLKQEREQLGGVNLRAEEEAAEQEQRLATLIADRDDLIGAIERLRRGIQSLNREGRERLLASFEKVNANFQTLFTKLFEGGEAKLTFTESEDPLEAGLEIFARPPGKRLQSLALLSGGEQALTAMALIFAVFLVNPAPVCVLDEVDAPLDDANVERFCNMLDEMTEHHRHPLPGHHPPCADHVADGPAVRRHHGGARGQPAGVGHAGRSREGSGRVESRPYRARLRIRAT